ncbi:hypothetical protein SCHPADRAFT_725202 [Schizopora paradoxa]|uniref:Uncharacterized protein n=1 Tax=Schizopora paradoxa TaxID=27342 RepID=A0A0H2R1A2_9AGAM|nr:hypothetical protein SCHPADRAFT_725202 [Schizopora paradoxa]
MVQLELLERTYLTSASSTVASSFSLTFRQPQPSSLARTFTFPPDSRRTLAALWKRIDDGERRRCECLFTNSIGVSIPFLNLQAPRPPVRRPANDTVVFDLRAVDSCMSSRGSEHVSMVTEWWCEDDVRTDREGADEGVWNTHVVVVIHVVATYRELTGRHSSPSYSKCPAQDTLRFELQRSYVSVSFDDDGTYRKGAWSTIFRWALREWRGV